MRKLALLLSALSLAAVVGCSGESASPTPTPTTPPPPSPSPTSAPETTSVAPPETGPASCVAEPFGFTPEPRIPPVTADDHVHGSPDAPITFFEYADFQ